VHYLLSAGTVDEQMWDLVFQKAARWRWAVSLEEAPESSTVPLCHCPGVPYPEEAPGPDRAPPPEGWAMASRLTAHREVDHTQPAWVRRGIWWGQDYGDRQLISLTISTRQEPTGTNRTVSAQGS
jgi:hypothetical protein